MEMLLTVEQAATRLHLRPDTVRHHLARGVLRGIKRGRQWRVPESALTETAPARKGASAPGEVRSSEVPSDVQSQVEAIMADMGSGDLARRNAAISCLFRSDEKVVARALEEINEKLKDSPDTADFSAWSVCDHDGIETLEAEERELREFQIEAQTKISGHGEGHGA